MMVFVILPSMKEYAQIVLYLPHVEMAYVNTTNLLDCARLTAVPRYVVMQFVS